ncbi:MULTISPECIES: ABC transporter permease [Thermomonospora]|uniref:Binding-protein-dependent transport systems inner membrane component n=1 Tax=Thermomonospora curvata (strain ATCC 19995 / DSM 43183 / JCM 3096 / KCTC 9072 / NBRC 15933 / NCIMB 10081 / Henssen B9) TaxID=471852 RepID=D1A693_THECD|nr:MULTISPECIES: ABC transporter permease [Thermomonospora]ACZ00192.1 binding-protein-dependent transport systems inner membrane component [Thermomonospora curvata DSM 43183]PKK12003.1 MAG: ABC transporter permease [Thermomonospora sp. CIF 1]
MRWTPPATVARGALGAAGLLALAEAAGRSGLIDPDVLPYASTILGQTFTLPGEADFRTALVTTMQVWVSGLAIAVAIAVPVGVVIGALPLVDRLTGPLLELLRPIPPVALIPLALLAFGNTGRMATTVAAFACSWPVLIHTIRGLRATDPIAVDTMRTFGFGRPAVLWHVALPGAAPFIATGVRVAAGISLIVTITAELYAGGGQGIGSWLIEAGASAGQTHVILGAVVWAGILGLTADVLLSAASRRLFHWHTSARVS